MALLVVAAQHVVAEIIRQITPHRVDVVPSTLGAVVLDQEGWSLHTVVVQLASVGSPRPSKADVVETGAVDLGHPFGSDVVGHDRCIGGDDAHE